MSSPSSSSSPSPSAVLRERARAAIAAEPVFDQSRDAYLSREALFEVGLRRSVRMVELTARMQTAEERRVFEEELSLETPFFLHSKMFTSIVRDQMDEQQRRRWLPLCETFQIIGAYAQTEMGHGSDVRGIETTATFDPSTDEFVLHSPTTTSVKWWPGALGNCATHAFVFAQLVLPAGGGGGGRSCDVFPFLVQLRDLDTHDVLEGREVYNIGPKMGFHGVDNGMLRLDQVRVPRDALPARYAHVTRDGQLVQSADPSAKKAAYGAMVLARTMFVRAASRYLASTVTIALRYSYTRTQFGERLMRFQTHKDRLLPSLAATYALALSGDAIQAAYDDNQGAATSASLHASTAGLKSLGMRICVDGMERCRRACGGAGYLLKSGIPQKLLTATHMVTAEGDSHVMTQQVTRFLLKKYKDGGGGGGAEAGSLLAQLTAARLAELAKRLSGGAHWNDELMLVHKTADTWTFEQLCRSFDGAGREMRDVRRLFELWALVQANDHLADLLVHKIVTPEAARALQKEYEATLDAFTEERVKELVDALDVSDYVLNSSIAGGDVYGKLLADLSKDPMNDPENETVKRTIHHVLRPFMRRGGERRAKL